MATSHNPQGVISGRVQQDEAGDEAWLVTASTLALRLDTVSATLMYLGESAVGSLPSAAVWRVRKIDTTSGLIITWANGEATFTNIWDNRAGFSYS